MTGNWQKTNYKKAAISSKKNILILITNSFAAMNVIHSGLLKKLSEDYQIHILSTMIGSQEILELNNHYKMDINCLDVDIPFESQLIELLRRIEKVIFSIHFNIETYRIKTAGSNPVLSNVGVLRFISPCISKFLLRILRWLIIFLSARQPHLSVLSSYRFDGIISTSPLDIRENSIVNFCKKQKIRTLAMIISWDNLTSKGVINAPHDYVMVWNKTMADEFSRFNSVFKSEEKVCITGIPRFDIYFQDDQLKSSTAFRKEFGIPSDHKIILFATSAPKHFPNQVDILEDLAEYMQSRTRISVIVRCHPADSFKQYDPLLPIKNLHISNSTIFKNNANQLFYKWLPDPDFLNSLAGMLKNCDVCVQVASTIRLDAAACNKPVISIAYDGRKELPYHQSVKRLYDYSHQIPLNQLGTDKMVFSKDDLFSGLDTLPSNDHQKNYLRKVLPMIHFDEAKSVDSILNYVKEWLQ